MESTFLSLLNSPSALHCESYFQAPCDLRRKRNLRRSLSHQKRPKLRRKSKLRQRSEKLTRISVHGSILGKTVATGASARIVERDGERREETMMRNVKSAGEGVVVKRKSRMMRRKRTRTKSAKGKNEGADENSVRKKRKMMTRTKSAKGKNEGAD